MSKHMIIIGAGIAGLATGCYAQMNGYHTEIYELHDKPGGLCTSWTRGGYTFDGCIHDLVGGGPASRLYRLWEELGATQGREMIYRDPFVRIQSPDGKALNLYTDLDRLKQHLLELAPADARVIAQYIRAARRFAGIELLALMATGTQDILRILPYVPAFIRWGRVTLEDLAARFSDPFLRRAFPMLQYDFPNTPVMINLAFLAGCQNRQIAWPAGGSLAFARAIEGRYLDLGGELRYKARVAQVLVRNDRAEGVRLADGSEHYTDIVISAADGRSTIYDLLGAKYLNERIRAYYAAPPGYQQMTVHLSLGVARDLSDQPRAVTYLLDAPVTLCGDSHDRLDVEFYGYDPSMAPAGRSVVKVLLGSRYDYWKGLGAERERYEAEKEQLAQTVIACLDRFHPGLSEQVEVVDVATPLTVERYTGNWQGFQAWGVPGNPLGSMFRGLSKTLPGLQDFYMVGQWAGATIGVSTVAVMGRKLVENLCKRDGKRFITTVPGA